MQVSSAARKKVGGARKQVGGARQSSAARKKVRSTLGRPAKGFQKGWRLGARKRYVLKVDFGARKKVDSAREKRSVRLENKQSTRKVWRSVRKSMAVSSGAGKSSKIGGRLRQKHGGRRAEKIGSRCDKTSRLGEDETSTQQGRSDQEKVGPIQKASKWRKKYSERPAVDSGEGRSAAKDTQRPTRVTGVDMLVVVAPSRRTEAKGKSDAALHADVPCLADPVIGKGRVK
ncbi:hypothetical protein HDU87_007735 [Geranomyces variabilis]|uniref:Uncharacterized protein n=1 Tax=Geranomyces variabilis TaxID=109894 RepID=A0AAD5TG20_9FUNG|nr:hypothetical protein HDU87_007735 [Geranomyces variabilis]